MKKYFKLISVVSLFLLLISCSASLGGDSYKERPITLQEALGLYALTGEISEYTEDEILAYFFHEGIILEEEQALDFRQKGFNYNNLNKAIKYMKTMPDYKETEEEIIGSGFTPEEFNKFLESLVAIYLLNNEYEDKGISLKRNIDDIIKGDIRVKQAVKEAFEATSALVLREFSQE